MKIDYVNFLNYAAVQFKPNNGRQLNFLDYGQHFNDNPNINNILIYEPVKNVHEKYMDFIFHHSIKKLRKINKSFVNLKKVSFFDSTNSDILLCDFVVFSILVTNNIPLDNYEKIFIFDCLELTLFFNNIDYGFNTFTQIDKPKIQSFIKNHKSKIYFLITDYNIPTFIENELPFIRYYKKINFDIFNKSFVQKQPKKDELVYYYANQNTMLPEFESFISSIKSKYPNIILTENFMDIWDYQNVLYTPKPYVNYIEQFGRMFFELTYFGFNVIVDNTYKKDKKSGLDYYIEYYQNHDINIKNENFMELINEYV